MDEDHFDQVIAGWARERPELDTQAMEVLGRISRIALVADREARRVFGSFGLDPGTFNVLASLRRAGPEYALTPSALLSSLWAASGAISKRIDRLERSGLVTRTRRTTDRRSVLVMLTPAGKQLIDKAIDAHLTVQRSLIKDLPATEVEALASLLRNVLHSLQVHGLGASPDHVQRNRASVADAGA